MSLYNFGKREITSTEAVFSCLDCVATYNTFKEERYLINRAFDVVERI